MPHDCIELIVCCQPWNVAQFGHELWDVRGLIYSGNIDVRHITFSAWNKDENTTDVKQVAVVPAEPFISGFESS